MQNFFTERRRVYFKSADLPSSVMELVNADGNEQAKADLDAKLQAQQEQAKESNEKIGGLQNWYRGFVRRTIGPEGANIGTKAAMLALNLALIYPRVIGETAYAAGLTGKAGYQHIAKPVGGFALNQGWQRIKGVTKNTAEGAWDLTGHAARGLVARPLSMAYNAGGAVLGTAGAVASAIGGVVPLAARPATLLTKAIGINYLDDKMKAGHENMFKYAKSSANFGVDGLKGVGYNIAGEANDTKGAAGEILGTPVQGAASLIAGDKAFGFNQWVEGVENKFQDSSFKSQILDNYGPTKIKASTTLGYGKEIREKRERGE